MIQYEMQKVIYLSNTSITKKADAAREPQLLPT